MQVIICATLDDSTLTVSMMRLDHGNPWLPVVQSKDAFQPVGRGRGERIVNRILEKLANRVTAQTSVAKASDSGKMVEVSK